MPNRPPEPGSPMAAAQRLMRPELPKRFYKIASVVPEAGGFGLRLDERAARTPARKPLTVDDRRVAEALAAEWNAQATVIDPAAMPLTRLVNAAIDRVAGEMPAVRADIVKYAGSDLICYRAEGPAALTDAQDAAWSPLVAWAREALGVHLALAAGVVHVRQSAEVGARVAAAIAPLSPLQLAALHVATTLTGSAIIALALLKGRLTPDEAWNAAHVDEDWQMSQWGADDIALTARADKRRDFDAAALVLCSELP